MTSRNDVVLGVKLPRALAIRVRERAQQDDRTVSAFLQRLIAEAVEEKACANG